MYSRVTQLEVDTLRTSVEAALGVFADEVLPQLRERPGYYGVYVLATEEGRGMIMTLWESEEAAEAGGGEGWYAHQLEQHVTLFRSPPGRAQYQVLLADAPAGAAG